MVITINCVADFVIQVYYSFLTLQVECSDRITTSGASSGGGTIGGTVSSGESRSGNSTTNGVAGSLELDIEQFTDYNNDSRCFQGNSGPAYAEVQPATMSQTIVGEGNKTYVRVTPVDSFSPFTDYPLNHQMISTQSAIQSGFHTFHPRGGSRMAMRNEGKFVQIFTLRILLPFILGKKEIHISS